MQRSEYVANAKRRRLNPFLAQWWVSCHDLEWRTDLRPNDEHVVYRLNLQGESRFDYGDDLEHPLSYIATYAHGPDLKSLDADAIRQYASKHTEWLVAAPADGMPEHLLGHGYDPLAHVGLHREFAALSVTKSAILAFAEQYGFLGRHTLELEPLDDSGPALWGEAFTYWAAAITGFRVLIDIWDGLTSEPRVTSKDLWFKLRHDRELVYLSPEYWDELAPGLMMPAPLGVELDMGAKPIGVSWEAWHLNSSQRWIAEAINVELEQGTRPCIEPVAGAPVRLIPKDLLAAMYVLFAQEVIGQAAPALRCRACGRWFIPKHGRQVYCDERCKFKGYRQRRKAQETTNG